MNIYTEQSDKAQSVGFILGEYEGNRIGTVYGWFFGKRDWFVVDGNKVLSMYDNQLSSHEEGSLEIDGDKFTLRIPVSFGSDTPLISPPPPDLVVSGTLLKLV